MSEKKFTESDDDLRAALRHRWLLGVAKWLGGTLVGIGTIIAGVSLWLWGTASSTATSKITAAMQIQQLGEKIAKADADRKAVYTRLRALEDARIEIKYRFESVDEKLDLLLKRLSVEVPPPPKRRRYRRQHR